MVPAGIEAWILPLLSLRLGKRFNHPTDVLTAGMGLKWKNIKFDAAFVPCNLEGDKDIKWTMGFTYRLPDIRSLRRGNKQKSEASGTPVDKNTVSDTIEESVEVPVKDMGKIRAPEQDDKEQISTEIEKINDSDTSISEHDVSLESEIDEGKEGPVADDIGTEETQKGKDENSTDSSYNKDKEGQNTENVKIEKTVVDSTKNSSEKENSGKGDTVQNIEMDTDQIEEVEEEVNDMDSAGKFFDSKKE
jgi:hypothetical protein